MVMVIFSLLFACTGIDPQNTAGQTDSVLITPQHLKKISDIEWHLNQMTLNGDPVPLLEKSKITFSCSGDEKVAGLASINRYFGNFKVNEDGGIIWNKALGMTRMAGPPELMKQEAVYMDALSKTSRMYLSDSKLVLRSKDRSTVLMFRKTKN